MKTEIMIAVLALLCIGSLAAAFVLWAKLDEQKQKTKEERDNYQAALQIGKTNAEYAQRLEDEKERSTDYSGLYAKQKEAWRGELDRLWKERNAMQDRLSSLLCPMNDHVWKDGVCAKCGRVKDAAD